MIIAYLQSLKIPWKGYPMPRSDVDLLSGQSVKKLTLDLRYIDKYGAKDCS